MILTPMANAPTLTQGKATKHVHLPMQTSQLHLSQTRGFTSGVQQTFDCVQKPIESSAAPNSRCAISASRYTSHRTTPEPITSLRGSWQPAPKIVFAMAPTPYPLREKDARFQSGTIPQLSMLSPRVTRKQAILI